MPELTARCVGLIGVGRMGLAMAGRLADQGFDVLATDVRGERHADAVGVGVAWADSLSEVAAQADVVITALPGSEQVAGVIDALTGALAPGATWIEMSTATPEVATDIARAADHRGVRTLDAPVGGNPDSARQGRLLAFVGGSASDLSAQRDLFDALTARVIPVGPFGSGYVVKLLVNFLWFGQALAAAEASSVAVRAGIDAETFRRAVQASSAASRFMDQAQRSFLAGDDMTSFSLAGCQAELAHVVELAAELSVPLALGERVTELYGQALERYGDVDGELLAARLIAERAGVAFGPPRSR